MDFSLYSNRKIYFSKKILNQNFVVFCPVRDSLSSEDILYVTTQH